MKSLKKLVGFLMVLWGLSSQSAMGFEVKFEPVADQVYAYVGPLTNRTEENLGLNNNIGLVVTDEGAVLIDSGAGNPSAKVLEQAVKDITQQPIVAVINTGSQDHRWLGNDYFAAKGAKIYALAKTVATQKSMALGHIEKMTKVSTLFATTEPAYAANPFEGEIGKFSVGGVDFELHFLGNAHFPGDAVLWLPNQKVLFSGDLIYVDRMLGVHPFSKVNSWQQAFHKAESFPARVIVPGHGQVCDWDKARQDTGNYLDKLVKVMAIAADDMLGVDQAVADNADWPEFKHLEHYDSWHKTILNRTYLQFEQGM
ncbi:MAG: MBL fold metallo-hydrolase [Thiomicrorhabdus chilensis]|uniref:MBL fold metallo-hydrolase n=1 Tax=Thiomicrorhabdus chilensis TaxID=63656 RepID=UPI00299D8B32|nr:MBL fold metallo-hydrolase [Thiomicrorhabdus chilensis]MDX1347880.1 MBL fold metallo-hydrolase [Thiomicrorhabdus chilensis]